MLYRLISLIPLLSIMPLSVFADENNKNYVFEVFLNDKPIGTHTFEIRSKDDKTLVSTNAEFDINIFFLNVYSYKHQNSETWHNDCLLRLNASTDDNGNKTSVTAERVGNQTSITSKADTKNLTDCVRSFAYWNPSLLNADQLLNPQTGNMQPAALSPQGQEKISIQKRDISAFRYVLETENDKIDLWYNRDYEWIALESIIKEGKVLRYERRISDNES